MGSRLSIPSLAATRPSDNSDSMQQQELNLTVASPPETKVTGFSVHQDYVTPEDESLLLNFIDHGAWESDWQRRIQQYGLGYSSQNKGRPIWLRDFPEWLKPFAARVARDAGFDRFPENCVINEYIPPLGIGAHKDYDAFGPVVACVSLGSDIVLSLTHPQDHLKVSVHVPRRSLWIMGGDARNVWRHGIARRLADTIAGERYQRARRVSITLRTGRDNLAKGSGNPGEARLECAGLSR